MTPFEYLYYAGYRLDRYLRSSRRRALSARTVSVGNITLGGTGKTPLVISIAEEASRRGLRVCILTRGYGSKGPESAIVSTGTGPLIDWEEAGDEPYMMAERLKRVWIVKDRNRYRGSLVAGDMDLFILDDGFQHWPVERDLDIITMDAATPFGKGRLFPLGNLREPVKELRRADMVVFTNAEMENPAHEEQIRAHSPDVKFFYARYRVLGLVPPEGKMISLDEISDRRAYAVSAIGSNRKFLDTLSKEGISVSGETSFRDHHSYSLADMEKVLRRAERASSDIIVTTEKDLVRMRRFLDDEFPLPVFALRVELEVRDENFYNIILD
jgi:tetraacyldisaccharide 4'-kinase